MHGRMISVLFVAVTASTLASPAGAQNWTAEQQEIWALEEQQWKMAAAEDLSWVDYDGPPERQLLGDRPADAAESFVADPLESLFRCQRQHARAGTAADLDRDYR